MYFEDRTVGGKNRILYTGVEFLFVGQISDHIGHQGTMIHNAYCSIWLSINEQSIFFNLITPYPVYRICIFDHLIILKDLE